MAPRLSLHAAANQDESPFVLLVGHGRRLYASSTPKIYISAYSARVARHGACVRRAEVYEPVEEYLELPTTPAETAQLLSIAVGQCGCGCTVRDFALSTGSANCTVMQMLRDRRFVVGILFARTLRDQLQREEWRRERAQTSVAGARRFMGEARGRTGAR